MACSEGLMKLLNPWAKLAAPPLDTVIQEGPGGTGVKFKEMKLCFLSDDDDDTNPILTDQMLNQSKL